MTLILHNRKKGKSLYGEKYKSPSFKLGKQPWYKRLWWWIKKVFYGGKTWL